MADKTSYIKLTVGRPIVVPASLDDLSNQLARGEAFIKITDTTGRVQLINVSKIVAIEASE